MIKWLLFPVFVAFGMIGGQWCKGIRRFGISGLATTVAVGEDVKDKKCQWKRYTLLLLAFILSIGYGENSVYMKVFKKDWLVRIAYGLTLSIPFLIMGIWIAPLLLALAWSVRAGGFKIDKYDWLWEDFVRYSTLSGLICYIL